MARAWSTILAEIGNYQRTKHPRINPDGPVLNSINSPVAVQIYKLELLIDEKTAGLSIRTATGSDLDNLVIDRLPEGRYPGTKATGGITFLRHEIASSDIVIPSGTILYQPSEDYSEPITFQTIEDEVLSLGETEITVDAEAVLPGENGNAPAMTITGIYSPLSGIHEIYNPLAFTGGTDQESDTDLRQRYIYTIQRAGRATPSMIVERLEAIYGVYEAAVATQQPGDIEIVVDGGSLSSAPADDIEEEIEESIAAGIVARGCLSAELLEAGDNFSLDTCFGGVIWVRPLQTISSQDTITTINYTNLLGSPKTASVTIPAGTPKGAAIKATMASEDTDDYATVITGATYAGSNEYDLLIGLGEYPYLWNMPILISVSGTIKIKTTATAEADLTNNIEASLEAFLDDYAIGVDVEFSDLIPWVFRDYTDNDARAFVGIEEVTYVKFVGKTTELTGFGQVLTIDDDERVEPGSVNVDIVE